MAFNAQQWSGWVQQQPASLMAPPPFVVEQPVECDEEEADMMQFESPARTLSASSTPVKTVAREYKRHGRPTAGFAPLPSATPAPNAPRKPSAEPEEAKRDRKSPFVQRYAEYQGPRTPVKKRLFEDENSEGLCLHLHRKCKRDGRSPPREVPHYVADESDEAEMLCLRMSTMASLDTPPGKRTRYEREK